MAEYITLKSRKVTRDKLASFLKNQELIKAFENIQDDLTDTIVNSVNQLIGEFDDIASSPNLALQALVEAALAIAIARDVEVQTLSGQLSAVRDELASIRTMLNDLTQGICP